MKSNSTSLCLAEVEVMKVKFSKDCDLGIDFSNEIDPWVKMEFKFRQHIKYLRDYGRENNGSTSEKILDFRSLRYTFREKLDF